MAGLGRSQGNSGRVRAVIAAVLVMGVGLAMWTPSEPPPGVSAGTGDDSTHARLQEAYGDLPLTFVENEGQEDPRVRFAAHGRDYGFLFTPEEIVLSLATGADAPAEAVTAAGDGSARIVPAAMAAPPEGVTLALRFLDANPDVEVAGGERAPGRVNYLHGNDPAGWHTGLPSHTEVVYHELWPGVDLAVRGDEGTLKYEFRLQPGADPGAVRLAYVGADGLALDDDGGLLIDTPSGVLEDAAPVSYQDVEGERVPVDSAYALAGDGGEEYGFALGAYDAGRELVIDPGVAYSTFLGGASNDEGAAIATDVDGNAYVVGITQSTDFPTTPGAFDRTFNGGVMDVFVAKLTADGSALAYATYLGGTPALIPGGGSETPIDQGRAIAVDDAGHAYLTGQTTSDDFPTTSGAFQPAINEGTRTVNDAFVTKLDATGGLAYSTFLGGSSQDDGRGIAVDDAGNAYVFGETSSEDFPVTSGAFQTSRGAGDKAAFLAKLNPTGSGLGYATYLGGSDNEVGEGVAVDADGNAYVSGASRSLDFPTTPGVFQPAHPGGEFADLFTAFVAKFNPTGTDLAYSTFLGGRKRESAGKLDVDAAGHASVTGATLSPEFPTTAGAFDTTFDGTSEAFVTKFTPDGSDLVYSTFLAGAGGPLALDAADNTWIGGGRDGDAYVALLSADGSALLDQASFGGADTDQVRGLALDAAGDVYVTGKTLSADFPTTLGAFDRTFDGDPSLFWGDAFVTKFGLASGDPGGEEPPPPSETTTTSFSGEIDKNQTLAHTVSITATGPVDLALDWDDSRVDLSLRARDPSDAVVFSDTSTAKPKSGSFSAEVTGDYRFELVNNTDRDADYTLAVTHPVASTGQEPEPEPAALSEVSLSPTSVTGGDPSTGTITLTAAAPSEGATVTLASSNTAAATVPPSVTVPAGSTSTTFTVSTSSVSADTSSTVSASFEGVTRTATLTVTAPSSTTDSVSISRAEYDADKDELRVEASSSSSGATLRVYVTATDELIGTLSDGKGKFSWPRNPENITVRSSLGGSATRDVALE